MHRRRPWHRYISRGQKKIEGMRRPSKVHAIPTSRDLLILRVDLKRLLVVSCDAAGGIGSKPHDKVKASPRIVGRMTARVALMEILATGADPISITGTFAVEPEPTGNQVLRGIEDEIRYAGIGDLPIVCSSEKNVRV